VTKHVSVDFRSLATHWRATSVECIRFEYEALSSQSLPHAFLFAFSKQCGTAHVLGIWRNLDSVQERGAHERRRVESGR